MNENDKQAEPVAWVPENWTVFNSGAEVKRDLSFQEAWDYMTPERLARGWCAVCVVDGGNMPTQAQPVQPAAEVCDLQADINACLRFTTAQANQIAELHKVNEQMKVVLQWILDWDAQRQYIMPYRIRDPINAVLKAAAEAEKAKGGV